MSDVFLPVKLLDPQNNIELDILLRDERDLNGQNKRMWLSYLSERLLVNSDEELLNRALNRLSKEGFISREEMESYYLKYELPFVGIELVSVKSIMFALTIKYRKLYLHYSNRIKVSEVPFLNISIKKQKVYCNLSKIYKVFTGIYFQDLLQHINTLEEKEAVSTINKFVREFNSYSDPYLKPFRKRLESVRSSIESDIANSPNKSDKPKWFRFGVLLATGEFGKFRKVNPELSANKIAEHFNLMDAIKYITATESGYPRSNPNGYKNLWNKKAKDILMVINYCKSKNLTVTQKFLEHYSRISSIEI